MTTSATRPAAQAVDRPATTTAAAAPLSAAAARLRRALDARWFADTPTGGRPPAVVTLGATDLTNDPDPARRSANVHLSAGTVVIGPWGGSGGPGGPDTACGHCFGVRWQRMRGRTERDALETGRHLTAVGDWPELPPYLVDAVWHLFRAIAEARTHDGPLPRSGQPRAVPGHLDGARQPAHGDRAVAARAAVPELRPLGRTGRALEQPEHRPKPAPHRYRLHDVARLPAAGRCAGQPGQRCLGAGALMNPAMPTTSPVTGGVFIRGYAGLLDVAWSGQAPATAQPAAGLPRGAGAVRRHAPPPRRAAAGRRLRRRRRPGAGPGPVRQSTRTRPTTRPDGATLRPDRPIPWVWGHVVGTGEPIWCRGGCASTAPGHAPTLRPQLLQRLRHRQLPGGGRAVRPAGAVERDAFLLGWYGGSRCAASTRQLQRPHPGHDRPQSSPATRCWRSTTAPT